MLPLQPGQVFRVACAATVLLLILGILYLAGAVVASGAHDRRAVICFLLAAIAAVIAYIMRPGVTRKPLAQR
jgi:hypothetical protein